MPGHETWQGFTLKPKFFADIKTGEILDCADSLKRDVETLHDLVEWQINSLEDGIFREIEEFSHLKPAAAGHYLGIKLPKGVVLKGKPGSSRFEFLFRGHVVEILRSWKARRDASNGEYDGYVSAGWKRTASDRPPTVPYRMNLGFAGQYYAKWLEPGVLAMVIDGHWVGVGFNIPPRYCGKLALPTVRLKDGELFFDFAVSNPYQQRDLNQNFLVGVDLGQKHTATWVVISGGKIIESHDGSRRVHSLENKVNATHRQVIFLHKKLDKRFSYSVWKELEQQRASLSRKRKELAKIVAQEIADTAYMYNCAVVVEDLSHIRNTMATGRWNRGEVNRWLNHYVEQNGSRVLRVNAAYTSQNCFICGNRRKTTPGRIYACTCGFTADRDVNAAANIASRGFTPYLKMIATRKKSKRYVPGKPSRKSPKIHETLKHPGQRRDKSCPTPKQLKRKSPAQAVKDKTAPTVWADVPQMVVQDSKKAARILDYSYRQCSLILII
ncbi:Putative transposase DNA-binding domain [Mobiluncus mulieris]|uniref:zinc ribbon domain-containing protein n=1 Tax=Mobiluncus mulieris TaxID=2052 RepID=UPI00019F9651|nr:zinc ribbon domain-containing protein [Mobiluncus mulieris]EEJ52914.1 transposase, IS605 OrfB family [Mobiluncus mulieris ATCC 35243]SPX70213.1 Putative transposase DNA-binding domain [Mobiluncus mulieris]